MTSVTNHPTTNRPLPPVIRIEPASACNLRCSHCPTGVVSQPRTVMRPVLFDRILSEVSKHVPPIRVAVLYHGGEPFLNKNFLVMAARVKALGIPIVKTVTNGMLIRAEMCDDIVTSGLDQIEVSLDGDDPADNDRIRVRADFHRLVSVVKALVTANGRNGRRLKISIATVQFRRRESTDLDESAPVPAFLREAFADVIDEIHFKPTWAMLWPSERPAAGYDLLHDVRPREPVRSCSLLEDTMSIRADGTVVACCYDLLTQSNLGNIVSQTLEEIWNGAVYRRFRENFAAGDYPPLCRNCVVVTGDKYLLKKRDASPQRLLTMA